MIQSWKTDICFKEYFSSILADSARYPKKGDELTDFYNDWFQLLRLGLNGETFCWFQRGVWKQQWSENPKVFSDKINWKDEGGSLGLS